MGLYDLLGDESSETAYVIMGAVEEVAPDEIDVDTVIRQGFRSQGDAGDLLNERGLGNILIRIDIPSINFKIHSVINRLRDHDREYCEDVLSTAAMAHRPLLCTELQVLINLPLKVDREILILKMFGQFLQLYIERDFSTCRVYFVHVLESGGGYLYPTAMFRSGPSGHAILAA
ncbi:hypothetical protein N0V93_010271 [Gnomoniopsis smithogilvyi]|uniref:Uncharacterized protein n=1 Tax=Gnomoniopsis smithogilvyi TaxID=1191159 RepID=A0A9W8YIB0_9PEZI|nr:hypothetical protein N0V93_010271 [Gnomoniopsis smithogilvyi]